MLINCPGCDCQLSVHDSTFNVRIPNLTCPVCNHTFKPDTNLVNSILAQAYKEQQKINALQQITNEAATQKQVKIKEPEPPPPPAKKEAGWLTVEDNLTLLQTYPLWIGKNMVGRKSKEKPCDIMIETQDMSMGRNHFWIEVTQNEYGNIDFILCDNKTVNHTYIVTNKIKEVGADDRFLLTDGDILRAGKTKIYFKENKAFNQTTDAQPNKQQKPFGNTMVINR